MVVGQHSKGGEGGLWLLAGGTKGERGRRLHIAKLKKEKREGQKEKWLSADSRGKIEKGTIEKCMHSIALIIL